MELGQGRKFVAPVPPVRVVLPHDSPRHRQSLLDHTHTWDAVLYVLGHQVVDSRHTLFLGNGSVIAVFNPYSDILQDLQQPHRRLSPPRGSYRRYPHHHRDSRLEFSKSALMIRIFTQLWISNTLSERRRRLNSAVPVAF